MRPHSAPLRDPAAVRAGGRLYIQSPLKGMSENEMINEARIRIAHNKQRTKLKHMLSTAANGGPVVDTRDLLLACKLAKLDMGGDYNQYDADRFVHSNYISARDCYGAPQSVNWKGFHQSIQYPQLHGPGDFPGKLPLTRLEKKQYEEYKELERKRMEADAAADEAAKAKIEKSLVPDHEVAYHHKILKRLLETRFGEIRRAFRLVDADQSGACDRGEMKHMLNAMFNLSIPEPVLDRMIDMADYDGDGLINFAEFARIVTADDVLNMKQTLTADTSDWGFKSPAQIANELDAHKMAEQRRKMAQGGYDQGYHPKLRKTGPNLDELRRAHKTLKKSINLRFPSAKAAFDSIDSDASGLLRRGELRRFLQHVAKTIPDRVISGLIDYCDDDGDGKTLSKQEFVKLIESEYLGSGGFDPNAAHMQAGKTKL